jgi:hypothetical protein
MRSSSRVCHEIPIKTDHFLTEVRLDVSPNRVITPRRDWNNANEPELRALVRKGLQELATRPMTSKKEADAWLEALLVLLRQAEELVPLLTPDQQPAGLMSADVKTAYSRVRRCAKRHKDSPTPETQEEYAQSQLIATELWKIERENAWNEHLIRATADSQGLYRTLRWARSLEETREPAHMPPLVEESESGDITHTTFDAQCDCLARELLLVPTDGDVVADTPELPFGLVEEEVEPSYPVVLSLEEVQQLLTDMPRVRPTVEHSVSNILLKLCQDIITPPLTEFCKSSRFLHDSIRLLLLRSQRMFQALLPPHSMETCHHYSPQKAFWALLQSEELETNCAPLSDWQTV